ncbi:MAG: glycosyltransferase family 4 protein [Hyphomicrobiaceae bacterium]
MSASSEAALGVARAGLPADGMRAAAPAIRAAPRCADGRAPRVLIIVENLPVPFDRRVWSEARSLKRAGYEVAVISPVGPGAMEPYALIDGIEIFRHPLPIEAKGSLGYPIEYGAALYHELRLAWHVHRTRGFDVIQACNPPDTLFLVAALFKAIAGTRFVFDHHDINPELYEAKFHCRGLVYWILRGLERASFGLADACIAPNESYRAIALGRGARRADDVFVVRSGPDLGRLVPVAPNPAWRGGRPHLIGYVGVIGQQEGIDLLLEAMRHMIHGRLRRDSQLVIAGSGPALTEMQALARRLNVDEYVTFTGRIDDAALIEMLSTADVCVNPDRVNAMNDKSTMNKVLEYMALGKPMVQFELAEGRISAGPASLYARANDPADLADKLLALLDDPPLRAAMGATGRARVEERFAWPHQEPALLAAYERALRGAFS